jgi:hypothetical protein
MVSQIIILIKESLIYTKFYKTAYTVVVVGPSVVVNLKYDIQFRFYELFNQKISNLY